MSFYNQSVFISVIILVFTAFMIYKNIDMFAHDLDELDEEEINKNNKGKKPIMISIDPSNPKDLFRLLILFLIIILIPYLNMIISATLSVGIIWSSRKKK